jgi:hypothetical protein
MQSELRNEDGWVLLRGGRIGRDPLFEMGLNYPAQVGLDEEDWIANEGSNPVAPVHNKPLTFSTTMRNFLFSPSAGSTIGRTRDLLGPQKNWILSMQPCDPSGNTP